MIQIEPMGREILYVAETPLGMVRLLEAGSKATQKVGDEVRIDVKEDSALLFNDDNERLIEGARVSVAGLAATG